MKVLLFLTAFVAICNAVSFFDFVQEQWNGFKLFHHKQYESETEERLRMKIYMDNSHKIAQHNKKYHMGLVSFKLKMNQFGDMLHHEFIRTFNGFNRSQPKYGEKELLDKQLNEPITFLPPAHFLLPSAIDWRNEGAVTPIKNQGACGSCWSFSATGALEGQHFRKTGKLVSLSEQNLIDCSIKYGNNGCEGGLMDNAFRYIKVNRGLDTENSYPYEAIDDKCRYNASESGATDKGYSDIESGSEEQLQIAVASVGPVSIAIDASQPSFQFYHHGIYDEPQCSSTKLDHGVLAVGYGTDENGQEYWLVKNSWGLTWGEQGYIKMSRNRDNQCGVATSASYPLV